MDRKSRKNQETTTMENLKSLRDDLEKIEADIALNQKRQAEVRQNYNDSSDSDGNSVVIRAQKYLKNPGMPDASVSFEEESRVLADTAAVLKKARQIKGVELQSLEDKVSNKHKKTVMPDFISCLEKKFQAIRDYEQAWSQESKIREGFADKDLKDVLPFIEWPGINPVNFRRQQEALQYRLEQMNLGHILK